MNVLWPVLAALLAWMGGRADRAAVELAGLDGAWVATAVNGLPPRAQVRLTVDATAGRAAWAVETRDGARLAWEGPVAVDPDARPAAADLPLGACIYERAGDTLRVAFAGTHTGDQRVRPAAFCREPTFEVRFKRARVKN